MVNWVTEAITSSFDQNSAINTAMTDRQAVRETSAGNTGNNGASFGFLGVGGSEGLSLVGLSATKIDAVRDKIKDQVAQIEAQLNNMDSAADTKGAFVSHDGAVEVAVKAAIDNVKQYVINLTSGLVAFSDKLADVKNTWQNQTGTMATNIGEATGSNNAGTKYSEKTQ